MLLVCVLLCVALAATSTVEIQRLSVSMELTHDVAVNSTIEYILDFTPSVEQSMWPVQLRVIASGGNTARPVLLAVRQQTGALTWQLPYRSQSQPDSQVQFEIQRMLCFNITESAWGAVSGPFSLHISTSRDASVSLQVSAGVARDWLLPHTVNTNLHASPSSPAVRYYRWRDEQSAVRLVVASEDRICATVAVQNYTCPISENEEEVSRGGIRLTMMWSGAAHVPRYKFPLGFFVVILVHSNDVICRPESEAEPDDTWLWASAAGLHNDTGTSRYLRDARRKLLTVSFVEPITVAQYALATSLTLAVFLMFYATFLGLVMAQRWPALHKYVKPKAVLANKVTETDAEHYPDGRRLSTATYDSLDDNSESDEEQPDISPPPPSSALAPPSAHRTSPPPTPGVTTTSPSPVQVAPADQLPKNPDSLQDTLQRNALPSSQDSSPQNFSPQDTSPQDTTSQESSMLNSSPDGALTRDPNGVAAVNSDPPNSVTFVDDANDNSANNNTQTQQELPLGLPTRLTLAALSRRRERTLRARADRYLHLLVTVAIFYALPVLQFVIAFQLLLYVSGSLDLCHYNFLCAHPLGVLSDFNHVFSNVGYLLLGALFMLQVRRRRARRTRKPRDEEYGIPAHYGLLTSLGAAMMVVALLSAAYHVCPNRLNFQFDTAFMYVLSVLVCVKLYQARHPDINARAHATFGTLAVFIALVVWGVLGGGPSFWAVWTVLHVFGFLVLSLRIYYLNQIRFDGAGIARAARGLAAAATASTPYRTRLCLLLLAITANWGLAIYGLWTMPSDFAGHLLMVLLGNALLYMSCYLAMKLAAGERLRWYSWVYTAVAAITWAPALYYFNAGSSSWSSTPAESRHHNHDCYILSFYDSHDIWHVLSAVALYFSFNGLLTWDDGLSAVRRTDIAVF